MQVCDAVCFRWNVAQKKCVPDDSVRCGFQDQAFCFGGTCRVSERNAPAAAGRPPSPACTAQCSPPSVVHPTSAMHDWQRCPPRMMRGAQGRASCIYSRPRCPGPALSALQKCRECEHFNPTQAACVPDNKVPCNNRNGVCLGGICRFKVRPQAGCRSLPHCSCRVLSVLWHAPCCSPVVAVGHICTSAWLHSPHWHLACWPTESGARLPCRPPAATRLASPDARPARLARPMAPATPTLPPRAPPAPATLAPAPPESAWCVPPPAPAPWWQPCGGGGSHCMSACRPVPARPAGCTARIGTWHAGPLNPALACRAGHRLQRAWLRRMPVLQDLPDRRHLPHRPCRLVHHRRRLRWLLVHRSLRGVCRLPLLLRGGSPVEAVGHIACRRAGQCQRGQLAAQPALALGMLAH